MAQKYSKYLKPIHFLGDFFILNISLLISFVLFESQFPTLNNYVILVYINIFWIIVSYLQSLYKFYRISRVPTIAGNLVKTVILHFLCTFTSLTIMEETQYPISFLYAFYFVFLALIVLWRVSIVYFLKYYRKIGFNYRNIVIVGYGHVEKELRDFFLDSPEYGYRFHGFFDDSHTGDEILGKVNQVEEYAKQNQIDEIYCSNYLLSNEQVSELINFGDNNLIKIKFTPQSSGFGYKKLKIDFYQHIPILLLRSIALDDPVNKFLKRTFDILFSLAVIIFILSWLLPILAILVKITSPGSIFFKQKRSGKDNIEFNCYKLRTMYVNNNADLKQAAKNDSRITPIGKFLRKSNLDELPQFFNVLIGNMSVVGPRPHMIKHTEEYSKLINKYMVRHWVKPGITGLSQAKGYRGETREKRLMSNRVKIDIFYLENWSFILDIKIIGLTIINMFKGEENAF